MEKQIETLTDLGTEAVQAAIASYANWYIVSAGCWLAFGIALMFVAFSIWNRRLVIMDKTGVPLVCIYLVVGLIAFIALLTIPCNVPDLVAPRAIAIHQLIEDARGK